MKWETPSDASRARRRPSWRAFAARAALLFGAALALVIIADHPATRARHVLPDAGGVPMVVVWAAILVALPRYLRCRDVDLLDLDARDFQVAREAVTDAGWNPLVLSSTRLAVEGVLASGAPFSLRAWIHVPWYPWSRYIAAIRVQSRGGPAAALIRAASVTVFPAESAVALHAILPDAQAFLREQGEAEIAITTSHVQVFMPRYSSVAAVKKAVDLALRLQAELESYHPGRYRDGAPPSATPEEIGTIEAAAERVWRSLPSPA